MFFRSSFGAILRRRNSRYAALSNSFSENAHVSDVTDSVFRTGFTARSYGALSTVEGVLWMERRPRIFSGYGSRPAIKNGLQSCKPTHMNGYYPPYASGLRTMHWITFLNYQQSGYYRNFRRKIMHLNSNAVLELTRVRSRFFSSGPEFSFPALWTLIGANVVVFTMWRIVNNQFMGKHFTVSIDSVLSGRLHTILTSAFSQRDTGHLVSNLIGLYFFGSEIARIFGGRYLFTLYFAGAVGGSVGHLFYFAYVYPWLKGIPRRFYSTRHTPGALGASGAVSTVMLLHIFLYPKHTLLLYMLIPVPAALVGAVIIGRDLWLAKQGDADVSVGGHLGGAVVALLAFLAKRAYWF